MIMNPIGRRKFVKEACLIAGGTLLPGQDVIRHFSDEKPGIAKNIRISRVSSNFEREPLIRPFGFKGGYMKEIWQSAAFLESDGGLHSIGLCSQSVLWSDATVFLSHSEA